MKNSLKIYLVLFWAIVCACDDPYKDTTFTVYDEVPIASFLSSRPEDFSAWVEVLEYTDLYNALNQSSEVYTVFAPTNEAVARFYEKKRVSSIEELGITFARELVKYHIVRDSVSLDDFTIGGMLKNQTLTGDYLEVTFNDQVADESGFDALYLNNEAHVAELAIEAANGLVYVLDDVMRPMIESVYEQMREEGKNDIMLEAMRLTGWNDQLDIIADTVTLSTGATSIQRRYYTVLGVPDEVYQANGITSAESLASKVGAGSDYTNPENALYRYIGYHILQHEYKIEDLKTFDMADDVCKLWETAISNALIKVTLENDGTYYFNYEGGSEYRAALLESESNVMVKNGYYHQLNNYMPVCNDLSPVTVCFDVTSYPELVSYISSNGVENQIYRTMFETAELYTILPEDLDCYTYEKSPLGSPYANSPLAYWTGRGNIVNGLHNALYYDTLVLGLGYMGHVSMSTPPLLPGKYKVSMHYIYVGTMDKFRQQQVGNGGQTIFAFTDVEGAERTVNIYSAIPENAMDMYMIDLFDEIEFTTLSTHTFKITVNDPAASTHSDFRILIDYVLFEPIN